MTYKTRFAPSPTGPLHLGHAFSALTAYDRARGNDGQCLLRIEDIDQSRARSEWETQIYEDLEWLGLKWPTPVMRQSERLNVYRSALEHLNKMGVIYPCYCTRADIKSAMSAPQEGAPLHGPDGLIYPGTCRNGSPHLRSATPPAIRLNMAKAIHLVAEKGSTLRFTETGQEDPRHISVTAEELMETVGDIVLSRRDMGTSYHLSVVLDDAEQDITEVVRGADLFDATKIHVVLQHLLALPTPIYHHHPLIRDDTGKRLAKRDDARAIALYRGQGLSANDIRKRVGL